MNKKLIETLLAEYEKGKAHLVELFGDAEGAQEALDILSVMMERDTDRLEEIVDAQESLAAEYGVEDNELFATLAAMFIIRSKIEEELIKGE